MPGSVDGGEPSLAVAGVAGVADDGVAAGVVPAEAQAVVTIPAKMLTSSARRGVHVGVRMLEIGEWEDGILEM